MTTLMQASPLGDTTVRRVGFGAMQLAGRYVMGPPRDPDAARAVLRRAVELGVNHIDTAASYGPDIVNALIAEVLHPYPEDLVIATKTGGARDEHGGWIRASAPAQLREQVEHDLQVLKLERLGLSTASADVITAALELTPLAEVQNAYGIANRTDEPALELCRRNDIAYVPYYPLGSAFTGGPQALAADPAIASVAARHQVTASQIALAWLLAHYDRMLLIPGTSSVAHLEQNLAVDQIQLEPDDLTALDSVAHLGGPGF